MTSSDFSRTSPGPDQFSSWKLAYLRSLEVVCPVGALYIVWRFLLKPIVKERTLSFDGMFVIACSLLWFYDIAAVNYFTFSFAYNAHFVNMGSWARFIPGLQAPNQQYLPEPLLFTVALYIAWIMGTVLLGNYVLLRLRAKYPTMSTLGLFSFLYLMIFALDLVFEPLLLIRTEIWAYPGSPRWATLWAGTRYQFPIYEPMLVGLCGIGWVAMRWFRDDRGHSFVERGVEQLRIPQQAQRFVSLLAVIGFTFVSTSATFSLPYNLLALKSDSFPRDLPSYMRAGICGQGTDYACPSRLVPIPRRGSLHIGPEDPRLQERPPERSAH